MKFLRKKPVQIGLIVASALMLVLIIAFCARPVSVGYTYSGKVDMGMGGTEVTCKYHFNSFNKVTCKMEAEGVSTEAKLWYFEKDSYLVQCGEVDDTTKAEFKDEKKDYEKNWDSYVNMVGDHGLKINAFKITSGDQKLVCHGAIATVTVLGVVELGLVALTVLSFVSKKK